MNNSVKNSFSNPIEIKTFVEKPQNLDAKVNKWLADSSVGPRDFVYTDGTKVDESEQALIDVIVKEENAVYEKAKENCWGSDDRTEKFKEMRYNIIKRVREELSDELRFGMIRELEIVDTKLDTTYDKNNGSHLYMW